MDELKARLLIEGSARCATAANMGAVCVIAASTPGASPCCSSLRYSQSLRLYVMSLCFSRSDCVMSLVWSGLKPNLREASVCSFNRL